MNRYRFSRQYKITVTDNRHPHIYICGNVGSLTVTILSANDGYFTV